MEKLIRCFYSNYTVGHYELKLDSVYDYKVDSNFEFKIIQNFNDLPFDFLEKMERDSNLSNYNIRKAICLGDKLVLTYLDGLPASYCFFAASPKKFTYFPLKDKEIYFFNCFTFEETRGKSAIFAEAKYVIEEFKKNGFVRANVEILDSNTNSIKAFSKLGFLKTKEYHAIRFLFIKHIKENLFLSK